MSENTVSYGTQFMLHKKEDGIVIGIYRIPGKNEGKAVEAEVDCVIGADLKFTDNST